MTHQLTSEMQQVVKLAVQEAAETAFCDHEARGMAASALQANASHEKLCVERAKVIDASLSALNSKMDAIGKYQVGQLLAVIAFLVAALGFLVSPFFSPHNRGVSQALTAVRLSPVIHYKSDGFWLLNH